MKLIKSNGKELEIRTVGPVIYRIRAGAVPIKVNGWQILEDDEARQLVTELNQTGLYERPE